MRGSVAEGGKIRMREKLGLKESSGANPAWLAVPLMVFGLITVTVGLVARQTVREPYATPFFHPFFTDTLQMKAWLVTAAVLLACGQLLTAARIYALLRFPPRGRFYHAVHRWSGRAASSSRRASTTCGSELSARPRRSSGGLAAGSS